MRESSLMKHLVNGKTFTLEQFRAASPLGLLDLHTALSGPRAFPGARRGAA